MAFFSKKENVSLDLQSISTLIGEGCVIEGNIKAPSYVRIDGQLTGDIFIDEGLILGEKGVIIGNVITKEMVVHGTINGNIQVNSLDIKTSGKITGEIRAQILTVETGAVYNGSLSMAPAHNGKEHMLGNPKQKVIEV